jgi:hypothetical protein
MNDSAVSEVVGFMIIFGIMLTGIGLITMYGYPMLMQEQQNTNIRNMERNMIVLQNDLKSLTYKNVPYQETMLQVSGGTLSIARDGSLKSKFNVDNGSTNLDFSTGGILYNSQDGTTTIALENGAVHTRMWSSEGSAMVSEPRWFYDAPTNTFVMTFIAMNATENFAQTGIGTVRMRITPADQINVTAPSGQKVRITYVPDPEYNFKTAWANYFDTLNTPDFQIEFNSGSYLLPTDTNVIIKKYYVTVISL